MSDDLRVSTDAGELAKLAEQIFVDALERDAAERSSFVAARCEGDAELKRAVASLLLAHERSGPFDHLAEYVASLRARRASGAPVAEDPGQPSLAAGAKVGRYEIRERLGIGGMGEVFRAFDPRLQRQAAIKVISHRVEDRPDSVARFEREARAASALNHPNIITVHDIDEHEGFPYIVMELVEGQSLHERLTASLPLETLLRLATQIAAGLSAAHSRGVVHRDLKPSNIVIDRHGTPKILDFGLASLSSEVAGQGETLTLGETQTLSEPLPGAGQLVGTVGYMAPEVIRGDAADHRADQFSLGVILYEMVTGKSPFRRSNLGDGLLATLYEEAPPIEPSGSSRPQLLLDLLDRCLQKEPAERFVSTEELHRKLASLKAPAGESSLPASPSRFIGRQTELERIEERIVDGEARLLTLTGAGGAGKTRLAIEAARRLEARLPTVVYVPLAAVRDPAFVPSALARAIVDSPTADDSLTEVVAQLNRSTERTLLVLDNFEQIIDAAPMVGELLAECPHLSVLATSREPLRITGEQVFPVRPLALPPTEGLSPEALRQVASVALFVDRAQAADPDFELRPDNASAVAQLCRRFDGLPLALELAAAGVRLMSPTDMLARLASRMDMLSEGPRDLPDRQRTLRAAMDWSYELLQETEQVVLRRLAAFVDGFTLEAAQAVVDPFANLRPDVPRAVESLLDQSLLVRQLTQHGEVRFSMLEIVREYARQRLHESEDVAALQRAHAAYFVVLAEEINAVLCREQSPEWLNRARREQGNFRAAFDWAIAEDEGEWGMRMAKGLFQVWDIGEGLVEGGRYMAKLLALPSTQGESGLRADVLFRAGSIAHKRRDFPANMSCQEEALAIYRRLDNLQGQAVALNALGVAYTDNGDYGDARRCYEECMQIWESLDESSSVAATLSNFAYVARLQGELEEARELYREAAAMCRRLDDPAGAAWKVSHEADVAREQADPQAMDLYQQALAAFRDLDDDWGVASVLIEIAATREQADDAVEDYRRALTLFQRLGHQRGVARALEGLALLEARQGHNERAVLRAAAAAALRERVGQAPQAQSSSEELQSELDDVRRTLGDQTVDRLWQQGRNTPIEALFDDAPDDDQA